MMDDQEMPDDKTLASTGKRDLVFTRVFDATVNKYGRPGPIPNK